MSHDGGRNKKAPPAATAPYPPPLPHGGRMDAPYQMPFPPPPPAPVTYHHPNDPILPRNHSYGYQRNYASAPDGMAGAYGTPASSGHHVMDHRPSGPPIPAPHSQHYRYHPSQHTSYGSGPYKQAPASLPVMGPKKTPPPPSSTLAGISQTSSNNKQVEQSTTLSQVKGKTAMNMMPSTSTKSADTAVTGATFGSKGVSTGKSAGKTTAAPSKSLASAPSHPHHQGKNPARKKRGRPVTSSRRGSDSGGRRRSSKKSQRRDPRPSTGSSSRSPSTATGKQQRGPDIRISSDEDPTRIVNPLLEIPSENSQNEPVHGSELITMTDIVFHKPDTYPLSYLGRLLGFDIPVPSLFEHDNADDDEDEKKQDDGALFAKKPFHPTPLPDVDALPFIKKKPEQDVFFQIPPAGRQGLLRPAPVSYMGDDDDRYTLDHTDPVYAYFLKHGFDKSRCKSGTAHTVAKVAAPLKTTRTTVREGVLDLARSLELLDHNNNDWTFADWTSWKPETTDTVRPQWTLDDEKIYTTPPTQSFGVMARYQGHPMVLLHYKFQWYRMWERKELELIMVMEGMVQRSGSELIAAQEEISMELNQMESGIVWTEADSDTAMLDDAIPIKTIEAPSLETTEQPNVKLPEVDLDENVRLILIALALDHARAADVWYCLWDAPTNTVESNKNIFRMVSLPAFKLDGNAPSAQIAPKPSFTIPMICDLKKCSSRYALLKRKDMLQESNWTTAAATATAAETTEPTFDQRALVRLPLLEEAKSCFDAEFAEAQRSKRTSTTNADSNAFTGASGKAREVVLGVRATLPTGKKDSGVKLQVLQESGNALEDIQLRETTNGKGLPQLDVLRRFPYSMEEIKIEDRRDENDEILEELRSKQTLLLQTETAMEPHLRSLMKEVVAERMEWEQPEAREKRAEEKRILKRMEEYVARRKEEDQARQEQQEQDMNAVCSICNDGEVTPENQILFCEACDVPVHQMCYGIEEIPEGDYYCIACRYFGLENTNKEQVNQENSAVGRMGLPPKNIRCQLCPIKVGAYTRTDASQSDPKAPECKWVHMACAKWQGLDFVVPNKPDMIEDVGLLKNHFRQLDIRCAICQRQRGAYHQCREEGCNKWLHVTCARALGVCEVVHGEDVEGRPTTNGWTLKCPEHSNIDPEEATKDPVPIERIMEEANELPDDPMPEPPPEPHKPFNKLTGKERKRALADPEYENEFLDEILTKRFAGMRCEVCWTLEDDGKNLARCKDCQCVICCFCRYSDAEVTPEQKYFKCFSCRYVIEKEKAKEEYTDPQCQFCNQNFGLLLASYANPVNRLTYWKKNEKEYNKTLYSRKLWSHYTCAFWLKNVEVDATRCKVDCTGVVMSNGRSYITGKTKCALCGLNSGYKEKCGDPNCRARGEKRSPYSFHITCARQAGYEVQQEDNRDPQFYLHCYFHGACEYNLRARLEDLIEIEKRRAGQKLSRSEAPMTFSDGSRLLNSAMLVIRILGWAWRWAEHWVESGSNWEPLIEPGQNESKMTMKELKIVESTPESRAKDARRCRLAPFGAALRNRSYDTEDGFDNESLCQALNAVLHTPSLVGPLKEHEIEFFVDWLARAYRSKSKFLALGDNKVPVAKDGFCVHNEDNSPKYELGSRPLPGKAKLEPGQVFEPEVEEPDDFLAPELLPDGSKCSLPPNSIVHVPKKKFKYKKSRPGEDESSADEEGPEKSAPKKMLSDDDEGLKKSNREEPLPSQDHKKKVGRPKRDDSPSAPSRSDSVAAMVPSAVKKRGAGRRERSSKTWSSPTKSPKIRQSPPPEGRKDLISTRKERGLPVLYTKIEYQSLLQRDNDDSVLRRLGRRGRPPRFLDLYTYITIGGIEFDPGEDSSGGEVLNGEYGSVDEKFEVGKQEGQKQAPSAAVRTLNADAAKASSENDSNAAARPSRLDLKTEVYNDAVEKEDNLGQRLGETDDVVESATKAESAQDSADRNESSSKRKRRSGNKEIEQDRSKNRVRQDRTLDTTAKNRRARTAESESGADEAKDGETSRSAAHSGSIAEESVEDERPQPEEKDVEKNEEELAKALEVEENDSSSLGNFNTKQKRILAGLDSPILFETRERKRSQVKSLDPSIREASYDDQSPPSIGGRKKRKSNLNDPNLGDPYHDHGMRRSSRHSSAREMSFKEADDSFSELDDVEKAEDQESHAPSSNLQRKKAGRSRKGGSAARKKRRGRPPSEENKEEAVGSEAEEGGSVETGKDLDNDDGCGSTTSKGGEPGGREKSNPRRRRTSSVSTDPNEDGTSRRKNAWRGARNQGVDEEKSYELHNDEPSAQFAKLAKRKKRNTEEEVEENEINSVGEPDFGDDVLDREPGKLPSKDNAEDNDSESADAPKEEIDKAAGDPSPDEVEDPPRKVVDKKTYGISAAQAASETKPVDTGATIGIAEETPKRRGRRHRLGKNLEEFEAEKQTAKGAAKDLLSSDAAKHSRKTLDKKTGERAAEKVPSAIEPEEKKTIIDVMKQPIPRKKGRRTSDDTNLENAETEVVKDASKAQSTSGETAPESTAPRRRSRRSKA